MHRLGTMILGGLGSSDTFLLDGVKPGLRVKKIKLRLRGPVVVGASVLATAADLRRFWDHFFGSFALRHGPGQNRSAYDGIDGEELRDVFRFLTWREVPNDFVGTTPAAAPITLESTMEIHFQPVWAKGIPRWPGSSQVRGMKLEVNEDSAQPAAGGLNLTRGAGNALIDVLVEYAPGPDVAVPILSYRRLDRSRLDVETAAGLVILAADENAAADATAITEYNSEIGDVPMSVNVLPREMRERFRQALDAGGSDFSDRVTVMYVPDLQEPMERWPTGRYRQVLIDQDVASQQLRVLMYPEEGEVGVREEIGQIARDDGASVVATVLEAPPDAVPGAAAFLPRVLRRGRSNAFQTDVGLMGGRDGSTRVVVPDGIRAQVTAAVGSAGGDEREALASKLAQDIARRVPGGIDALGSRRGAVSIAINEMTAALGTSPNANRS